MTKERFKAPVAVHLFLIRDAQILLLRRYNTGYEDGSYSVIAGHLDGNEQVVDAAIREAREEAGITIEPEDVEIVGVMHRKAADERIDFFAVAHRWHGHVVNNEPDKCDQLAWFPLDRLPDNLIGYVRKAIDNYRQNVWFDSFGWTAG
ncbi:MAG: NUDIX domain-containing protein [Brevibacillus sp.]|nr:NUDIX domain-containing protein [Brevibacillus sp.]